MKPSFLSLGVALLLALLGGSCVNPNDADFESRMAKEKAARKTEDENRAQRAKELAEEQQRQTKMAQDTFIARNPNLSTKDRAAILEKRPIVGLTVQEVWDLIGPIRKITESDGVGGSWATYDTAHFRHPKLRLYFENGLLVRWLEI